MDIKFKDIQKMF